MDLQDKRNNLENLIGDGIKISQEKANRSYLFSSFKRTVQGWDSDLKKATKEITNGIDDEKTKGKINKLIEKMQKEAKKYLENKKNYLGEKENEKTVVKNPKVAKAINEKIAQLNKAKKYFKTLIDQIQKNDFEKCKNAYEQYQELLNQGAVSKIINIAVNSIKNCNSKDAIKNIKNPKSFVTEIAKNNELLEFALCYNKISPNNNFSKWLKDEYDYLKDFEKLSPNKLKEYQKHGAFIDHREKTSEEAQILEEIEKIYKEIPSEVFKDKRIQKILPIISISIGSLCIVGGVIILIRYPILLMFTLPTLITGFNFGLGSILIKYGIQHLKSINSEPIIDSINSSYDHIAKQLDAFIDSREEKVTLNDSKVEYMRNLEEKLENMKENS